MGGLDRLASAADAGEPPHTADTAVEPPTTGADRAG